MKSKHYILLLLHLLSTNIIAQRMTTSEADALIKLGDFNRAKIKLDEVIDYNPLSAEAYIKRAQVHRTLGMNHESNMDLKLAEYLNPLAQIYINNQQRTQYYAKKKFEYNFEKENNQFSKTPIKIEYYREYYNKISEYHNQDSVLQEAISLLKNGQEDIALEIINEIKSNERIEGILQDLRGLIAMKEANFEKAIDHFTKSIEIMPDFPMAFHNRSICYKKLGKPDQAKEDIQKAIKLNDNISLFYFTSAKINQEINNTTEALEDYKNAITLDNEYVEARINYGMLLKTLGNYEESMIELDYAISLEPENLENYFIRGCMHLSYAEYTDAIEDFNLYLSQNSKDADAIYNLGLAMVLNGDENQGCENIEESLSLQFNTERAELQNAFCSDIKF